MAETTKTRYIEAVGRRKTAICRARITEGNKSSIVINDRDLVSYFPTIALQQIALEAINKNFSVKKFAISAHIKGGGIHAQAEALRMAISRALVTDDAELRTPIKKAGFLKRDPRAKERRKFGLKKARKAPQWSKR
jgi:small subunit ribosomal protein S9